MATEFQNFYESTLSGPITNSDLVIPINVPPSVNEGWLLIDYDVPSKREFVYFTSSNSTTVTVPGSGGRGQDGTTAIAHTQNAKVRMNVNAGILEGLQDGSALTGIGNANLATTAGDIGGAWKTWTPVFTGLSGGTIAYARYTQIGKTVHFRMRYVLGGAGVSGSISMTVPVTADSSYGASGENRDTISGTAVFRDTSANLTVLGGSFFGNNSNANVTIYVGNSSGTYDTPNLTTSTIPFTWASGDSITVNGTYEAQ